MPGGSVVWSTVIPVGNFGADPAQYGPGAQYCTGSPMKCWACNAHGHLGGVVVGTTGDALAAVPWATCGQPNTGPGGIEMFQIDPSGSATTPAADQVATIVGTTTTCCGPVAPPVLTSFAVAGASDWWTSWSGAPPTGGTWGQSSTLALSVASPNSPTPYAIAGDAAGNTFALSGLDGNPTFNALTLYKWNGSGANAWSVPPSGLGPWFSPPIVADGMGGVFVAGQSNSAYDFGCGALTGPFLVRLDTSGHCVWNKAFTGVWSAGSPGGFAGLGLLATECGQLYVVSPFQGTVSPFGCGSLTSPSGTSTFIAKLDASGACLWAKSFATSSLDVELYPGIDDLLLSTPYTGTIDLGTGPLTSVGTKDLAVGRLSAAGTPVWSRTFGGTGAAVTWIKASAEATGAAVEEVSLSGSVDFGGGAVSGGTALVKLDATGAFRWQKAPFSGYFDSDPCGAVIMAADCASCAPGSAQGVTVTKLAP